MFFYIAFFSFLCSLAGTLSILYSNSANRNKIFISIAGFLLFCLYYFKADTVGVDYVTYLKFFDRCYWIDYNRIFDGNAESLGYEKGYVLLNKIISDIYPYHVALNIVLALFFSCVSCFLLMKYTRPLWMGLFLLMTLSIYTNAFCLIRQSLAMFLCWMSINSVLKRKPISFFLLVTIAFYFHKTALIFIPVYFMVPIRLNFKLIVLGLLGSYLLGSVIYSIMEYLTDFLQANDYLDYGSSGGMMKFLFFFFSFFFIYIFLKAQKQKNDDVILLFVNMLFFMLLIQSLALHFSILTRVTDYFIFSLCVLYPLVLVDKFWGRNGALIRLLFIFFFLYFFYVTNKANLYSVIPYRLAYL